MMPKSPPTIAVLDGESLNPGDLSWAPLETLGQLTVYPRTPPELLLQRAATADILLTNKCPLRAETLAQLPRLRFISVLATGYDVVDVAAAKARHVHVANVPDYSTQSVAELVFALILDHLRDVSQQHHAVRAGEWQRRQDFSFQVTPQRELAGRTLGIIGFGRIGSAVARIAHAFGLQLLVASPRQPISDLPLNWLPVDEIFRHADLITLHAPLTPTSHLLVNHHRLALAQPHLFLVNTSRGGLVDEIALADALRTDRIAGAALDVCTQEPIEPQNPLLHLPNCRVTPHVGWATLEARQRLLDTTVDNIRAFLAGDPIHLVTPAV